MFFLLISKEDEILKLDSDESGLEDGNDDSAEIENAEDDDNQESEVALCSMYIANCIFK